MMALLKSNLFQDTFCCITEEKTESAINKSLDLLPLPLESFQN